MMGIKAYQEKMFYNFSLSKRVPEDHLLKKLDKIIDLRFVRELTSQYYSHTGQPSIDPEVLFKMMLIGYFYGITSERRLAENISLNLAYMWYLGYDLDEATPHHSVISKARARYGKKVFEQFFKHVLELCVQAGLVSGEKIFADSTFIRANASLKSIVSRPDTVEPPFTPKDFIQKVFTENPVESEQSTVNRDKISPSHKNSSEKLSRKKKHAKVYSNKTHVSKTDPDASIISRGHKLPTQLTYKEHFTVDSQARVITAVEVTPGAIGDESVLSRLIEQQPVPVKEVGADSKYGTFDNYAYLLKHNLLPSIPPWKPGRPYKSKRFAPEDFKYNPVLDIHICPAGKTLVRGNDKLLNNCWTYRAKKKDCRRCKLQRQCIVPPSTYRRLFRHIHKDARDKALLHLETEQAKETLRQRKTYPEWINSESKNRHGLRRAICRGIEKVSIQVLLIASVQNLKRLVQQLETKLLVVKEHFLLVFRFFRIIVNPYSYLSNYA